ncbi:MAG: GTP-binding protein [Planctomycetota bacterium]|jgi:signal recognition particle receptor subunit beta
MVQVNFAEREVQCKVVYYGPAHAGKTTNLRTVHARSPEHVRGNLTSISMDGERTLFFDYLPLDLGRVAGIRTKLNLYSVPYIEGQNALRVLVLEGVDGLVFVADSSRAQLDANREALENLRANLAAVGRDLSAVPLVFQWNKSDCDDAMTDEEMTQALDAAHWDRIPANSLQGAGVVSTLKAVTRHVLEHVSGMMAPHSEPKEAEEPAREPEATPVPPVEEPVFRPAWYEKAPSASTHSSLLPDLPQEPGRAPVDGIQHGAREITPQADVADLRDEPLELERPGAGRAFESGPPAPSDLLFEKAEDLKNWSPEAESAPGWDESEHADPFMDAESADKAFPAFGGGMGTVSEQDDQFVTVGGGGTWGPSHTIRQHRDSWDPQNSPRPLRRTKAQPALDRRRRTRKRWRVDPPPLSNMLAGAAFAVLWLAATGYLVKELL